MRSLETQTKWTLIISGTTARQAEWVVYLRETFRGVGMGAKFSLDTDEVLWKGENDPNRIQQDSSNSYCILDRVTWGWLLEVEKLRSTF